MLTNATQRIVALVLGILVCVFLVCYIGDQWLKFAWQQPKVPVASILNYPYRTGDILLASTDHTLPYFDERQRFRPGPLIKMATGSAFHHIAMCWVDPATGKAYAYEMNRSGMRLVPVERLVIESTHYNLYIRPINKEIDPYLFKQLMEEYKQKSIQFDFEFWRRAWRRWIPVNNTEIAPRESYYTCARFAFEIYKRLGVLDATNEGHIMPSDFAEQGIEGSYRSHYVNIQTLNGYGFGHTVQLVLDDLVD